VLNYTGFVTFLRCRAKTIENRGMPSRHDRRRHRVYFTQNTEYHLRGRECVGVRNRHSLRWLSHHAALRLHAVDLPTYRGNQSSEYEPRIVFSSNHFDVVTSPVLAVDRPKQPDVIAYVSQACSGQIQI